MTKVYEPKGKAREYSPLALNNFKGCDHGCQYCYVPQMMKAFNSQYQHENVTACNWDAVSKSVISHSKSPNKDKQVFLSFMGDPYCGFETGETRKVIDLLLSTGCHVSVLTKNPQKALRDIDIMKKSKHFKIGTTLTALDDDSSRLWEPNAPTAESRISALKVLFYNGIKTWVSFEPVLYPDQSLRMIKIISPYVDHIKIGKLNNHPHANTIDWVKFLHDAVDLCRYLGVRFYIKNDLANVDKSFQFNDAERDADLFNV